MAIREPLINAGDKSWVIAIKDLFRAVKDELERITLRGDGVTTSVRNGIVSAFVGESYPGNFDYIGFVNDEDSGPSTLTIGAGYIKVVGGGYLSKGETDLSVATSISDGSHYLALEINPPSSIGSFFIADTILQDDIDQGKIYYYLYKFTSETASGTTSIKITFDMRSSFSIMGF